MNASRRILPFLLLAGAAPATAQPVFHQEVDLVSVDVLVLDERGRPLTGLAASDFTLEEDGDPQPIRSFQAVSFTEAAPTTAADSVVSASAAEAVRPERSFLVVVDDVHLSPRGAERAKKEIGRLLDSLAEGDRVTLVPTSENTWWTARLPEGREDLRAFLDRLRGQRPTDLSAARLSDWEAMQIHYGRDPSVLGVVARRYYENGRLVELMPPTADRRSLRNDLELSPGLPLIRAEATQAYEAASQRMERTLDVMERAVGSLRVVPGRKAVLVVSEGFVHDTTRPEFRALLRAAREANAVLSFFDARGQAGPAIPAGDAEFGNFIEERDRGTTVQAFSHEAEGVASLAIDTGGRVVTGTDDLAGAMGRVVEESRAYYLLGFAPTRPRDGKFHSLDVKVARRGIEIHARRGYYAADAKEPRPPKADALDPRVRDGLVSPFGQDGLPLRLTSYVLGWNPDGAGGVLLAADVDLSGVSFEAHGGRAEAALETWLVVTPREGGDIRRQQKRLDLSLPPDALAGLRARGLPLLRDLTLPPGVYQARLLVRDPRSGAVGTVQHTFTVPRADGLRVSTPVLTDTLEGGRPVPIARRGFARSSPLVYAFEVFGGRDVRVSHEVRTAAGDVVAATTSRPLAPGADGSLTARLELPLAGLAPGAYAVRLVVEDPARGQRLERSDPFTVVP